MTGNTVIDALARHRARAARRTRSARCTLQNAASLFSNRQKNDPSDLPSARELWRRISRCLRGVYAQLANRPDVQIVFPIHRNPNVRAAFSLLEQHPNVTVDRTARLSGFRLCPIQKPLHSDRQRRRAGGGAVAWQAGTCHARS